MFDASRERACSYARSDSGRDRQLAAEQARHPVEQHGGIGGHAGEAGNDVRIVGRNAVDDGEARFDGRAVPRVNAAIDGGGEDNAATLLQSDEGVAPGGIVGREAGAGDRDEASAFGETGERRRDMTQGGVGDPAVDMRGDRKGRVHQHDARAHRAVEMIVDMGRVVLRDGNVRKEPTEQGGAGVGQFVQDEAAAGEFGEDGEKARAGRRFQHEIGGRERGGRGGGEAERDRRGELLQRLALFRAARVRRQQRRDLRQHGEHRGGRARAPAHAAPEFAQEQNRRRFAGVIGGLPVPGAIGVGAAKGGGHHRAQGRGVDGVATRERIEERMRRSHERCGNIGRIRRSSGHGRAGGRRHEHIHGGDLGRAGWDEPAGRSLWTPTGSNPSRPVLCLSLELRPTSPGRRGVHHLRLDVRTEINQ